MSKTPLLDAILDAKVDGGFIRNIEKMYLKMTEEGAVGLSEEEFTLYRTYCERFTNQIIFRLIKEAEKNK